jgi:hypothetical protein
MRKIAIVEDNPDNLLLFRAMLEDLYEVTTYETGLEAAHCRTIDQTLSSSTSRFLRWMGQRSCGACIPIQSYEVFPSSL